MAIVIGIIHVFGCVLCFYFSKRVLNNQFGWGERALEKEGNGFSLFFSLIGFAGLFILFLSDWQYCFLAKEKALELYDAKNLRECGYYIGRQIAKDEGRLPEGVSLK